MADLYFYNEEDKQDDQKIDDGFSENGNNNSIEGEKLSPLAQLQRCAFSDDAWNRQMVGRLLLQLMRENPASAFIPDMRQIMALINEIIFFDSTAIVKTELIERIPQIAMACMEFNDPEMAEVVSKYILPLVVKCYKDVDPQVRKSSQTTTLVLIEHNIIGSLHIKIKACPIILEITQEESEDLIVGAITFMAKLARFLGRASTERIFLRRFVELCSYDKFAVRKAAAASMGDFCAVVGPEAFESVLLPKFVELCNDSIWGVRKHCAEVIMAVSCACPPHYRRSVLSPAFEKLLDDHSRWVKVAAFESLGPFISTFAEPRITDLQYSQNGELVIVDSKSSEFISELGDESRDEEAEKLFLDEIRTIVKGNFNMISSEETAKEEKYWVHGEAMDIDEEVFESVIIDQAGDSSIKENELSETMRVIKNGYTNNFSVDLITNDLSDLDINTLGTNDDNSENKIEDMIQNKNIININTEMDDVFTNNIINNNERKLLNNDQLLEINGSSQIELAVDDLDKYNSHHYWSVPIPDIPIDLDILHNNSALKYDTSKNNNSQLSPKLFPVKSRDHKYRLYDIFQKQNGPLSSPSKKSTDQNIVPPLLIESFQSMTDISKLNLFDAELSYHCAFSFPAVALTIGKENWPLLAPTYSTLAVDLQWRVRRAVAGSLHEIATILGEQLATEYLAPIFDDFIKDVDQVRIGVLKNMTQFFKFISPIRRNQYLPRLNEFLQTDASLNWRFRCELSNQLLQSLPLWPSRDAAKHIMPVAMELLQDKVAAVRSASVLLVSDLIHHMELVYSAKNKAFSPGFIINFAHSKGWQRRQIFVSLCGRLVNALPPETFAKDIMPHFIDLCWDPVANVRLLVARVISQNILKHEFFADPNCQHNKSLVRGLKRLQTDDDRDVRQAANEFF